MEGLVAKGLTRSIGVSNFNAQLLWDLLTYAQIKPAVNQIELNPQNPQRELVKFLLAKDIRPVAYTHVARPGEAGQGCVPSDWPDLRNDPILKSLAEKYNKSVVQIMLNWGLCRGHVVIPKATKKEHQLQNLDVYDFKLSDEEVKTIESLDT